MAADFADEVTQHIATGKASDWLTMYSMVLGRNHDCRGLTNIPETDLLVTMFDCRYLKYVHHTMMAFHTKALEYDIGIVF